MLARPWRASRRAGEAGAGRRPSRLPLPASAAVVRRGRRARQGTSRSRPTSGRRQAPFRRRPGPGPGKRRSAGLQAPAARKATAARPLPRVRAGNWRAAPTSCPKRSLGSPRLKTTGRQHGELSVVLGRDDRPDDRKATTRPANRLPLPCGPHDIPPRCPGHRRRLIEWPPVRPSHAQCARACEQLPGRRAARTRLNGISYKSEGLLKRRPARRRWRSKCGPSRRG
jgi:hypothetical protein